MPIPVIRPYALPAAGDLPAGPAAWVPDPDRAVLLVHDMQQYFVDFFPAGEPVTTLLANIRRLRAAAVAAGIPIVYTAQPGSMSVRDRGLLRDFWGPGMAADEHNRRIVAGLTPGPADVVLTKWRYSAFHRTDLEERLRAWGRDQLLIVGVYAHVGCMMTAADAFSRDVQPFLIGDAVADFTAEEHAEALRYAARRCAMVPATAQVLAALGADRPVAVP
jgi:bifunctional isochorismate lyase/aryl carrier protein